MESSILTPETETIIPVTDRSDGVTNEEFVKLSGRQRLLRGLQRISSSPSLVHLGRRRATSNPYGDRSSLSCVSLASGSNNYGPSGFATGVPISPRPASPPADNLAIRRIARSSGTSSPTSIPLPQEIRPGS